MTISQTYDTFDFLENEIYETCMLCYPDSSVFSMGIELQHLLPARTRPAGAESAPACADWPITTQRGGRAAAGGGGGVVSAR